ncbi:MAG: hypothetical protein SWX82_23615 [Cyanobacteriota bacterium]|nr:hypothetical protein [Cyanobacteriota bacterium]
MAFALKCGMILIVLCFVFCALCFVFCALCFVLCVLCFVFCALCFVFCGMSILPVPVPQHFLPCRGEWHSPSNVG